jgi:hypothetical protein
MLLKVFSNTVQHNTSKERGGPLSPQADCKVHDYYTTINLITAGCNIKSKKYIYNNHTKVIILAA